MKTLTIKDLAVTEQLDSRAMSAVRGGYVPYGPNLNLSLTQFTFSAPKTITAEQLISQTSTVNNANGNNVAFASGIDTEIKPTQTANNNITMF